MDTLHDDFLAAQASLDTGMSYVQIDGAHLPAIYKFDADRNTTIPIRIMTGELSLGDPFTFKFMRGVALYGTGSAQMRVFVDRAPVVIYRPIGHPQYGQQFTYANVEMAETPDPQRVMWLPRGTKGRTINIELAGNIKHIRSLMVYWDALTGEEDG